MAPPKAKARKKSGERCDVDEEEGPLLLSIPSRGGPPPPPTTRGWNEVYTGVHGRGGGGTTDRRTVTSKKKGGGEKWEKRQRKVGGGGKTISPSTHVLFFFSCLSVSSPPRRSLVVELYTILPLCVGFLLLHAYFSHLASGPQSAQCIIIFGYRRVKKALHGQTA